VNRRLALLLIVILAIKAIFFALDAEPLFHFRDSAVYLATAIGKWIPPDNSFVYGLLLRPVALWPRSLLPIVVMQAALSGIASWLIAVCLVRYFATGFMIAAVCSLVCAIEPLQLLAERYVLTESVLTFVFAVFLVAVFSYLKTSSLSLLALIQIIAVLLISLRVSFVLLAWIASLFIPLCSRRAISFWRSSRQSIRRSSGGIKWISGIRFVLLPLFFSILLSQSLLFGYRHLYGELLQRPPAYTYGTDLARIAGFGLLNQAASKYVQYFNAGRFSWSLQREEGQFVDALPGETQAIKVAFGIDVARQSPASLARKWQERCLIWCWCLVVLPMLYPVYLAVKWRRIRMPHVVVALCGILLLLQAVLPAGSPVPRYLTALGWLAFLMIGSMAGRLLKRGERL
jgi:hypothetical protein